MQIKLASLVFLLLTSLNCWADSVEWRGYQIYYTSLNSMLIPQNVAKAHNIVRSKNRIVTNISIRKEKKPIVATLKGTNQNLFGQIFTMNFDEVLESTAIYYLSNQLIDERDTLSFDVNISIPSEDESYALKFKRQY